MIAPAFLLAFNALTLDAAQVTPSLPDDPSGGAPAAEITFSAVFANRRGTTPPLTFDRGRVEALIPRIDQGAIVELDCGSVSPDGRLLDCRRDVFPEGRGFELAADAFEETIRIADEDASHRYSVEPHRVVVQVTMWNWDRRPYRWPCRPPICSAVVPAPPLPVDSSPS